MHRLAVDVVTGVQTIVPLTPTEIAAAEAAKDALAATQYQRDRVQAYPSVVEQLDALYHGGYDGWHAAVQAVKDRYPKGI